MVGLRVTMNRARPASWAVRRSAGMIRSDSLAPIASERLWPNIFSAAGFQSVTRPSGSMATTASRARFSRLSKWLSRACSRSTVRCKVFKSVGSAENDPVTGVALVIVFRGQVVHNNASQYHRETGSLVDGACHRDAAAMQFDGLLHNGQAQAGPRNGTYIAGAMEGVKQVV
jgi:hypothetical protein